MTPTDQGWTLVDRQYAHPDRYPDHETLEDVDAALDELSGRRDTVRYWHVSSRTSADDASVVAALDLFAELDLVAARDPADPRTTTAYRITRRDRMAEIDAVYGYAETPYLLPALG